MWEKKQGAVNHPSSWHRLLTPLEFPKGESRKGVSCLCSWGGCAMSLGHYRMGAGGQGNQLCDQKHGISSPNHDLRGGKRSWTLSSISKVHGFHQSRLHNEAPYSLRKGRVWRASRLVNQTASRWGDGTPQTPLGQTPLFWGPFKTLLPYVYHFIWLSIFTL